MPFPDFHDHTEDFCRTTLNPKPSKHGVETWRLRAPRSLCSSRLRRPPPALLPGRPGLLGFASGLASSESVGCGDSEGFGGSEGFRVWGGSGFGGSGAGFGGFGNFGVFGAWGRGIGV